MNTKVIVDPEIGELSPRKRKMKRQIDHLIYSLNNKKKHVKRLQDKNRVLLKKNANLKEILNTLSQKSYITEENENILSCIGVQNRELVKRQILKSKTGHMPKLKYSPELRAFALTLHFYSPKAYNFVRKTFSTCLPATSTLRKWYQSVDGKPGFTKEAIDAIKIKATESKQKLYATIIFDEMAIRSGVEYHPQGRRYYGHVSFGTSLETDCQDEAKEALVFLLVPINASWKIPIGYFLINGVNSEQKVALLTEAIHLVEEAGVGIKAVTFDGCPANLTMAKKLGCSFEGSNFNTTFKNPSNDDKIAVFLDPAHMIKLIRNAFECYKNFQDKHGETISWQHLVNLHNLQEAENFHLANRIRAAHIFFKSKIMKVSLATQIFSKSVSDSLMFCKEQLNLREFEQVTPTARFLDLINDLFDILDSHTHGYGLKRAVNVENATNVLVKLRASKDTLLNLSTQIKIKNTDQTVLLIKSPRYTGFLGFCVCIESAIYLIQDLVVNPNYALKYLPLHKISQDHLEHFFGSVRCHGGSNNNPSARQFESIYKKLLTYAQIRNSGSGNCSALHQMSILQCTSPVDRINVTTRYRDLTDTHEKSIESENVDFPELEDLTHVSEFGERVLEYMAGYTVHALIKKLKCQTCIGALIGLENVNSLQYQKDLNKNKLLYGSTTVIEICRRCEMYIKRSIKENGSKVLPSKCNTDYFIRLVMKSFIGKKLFPEILFHQFEVESSNHLIDLTKCIIQKYVDARLSFLTKHNQDPKAFIRKTYTKLIHFKNQ